MTPSRQMCRDLVLLADSDGPGLDAMCYPDKRMQEDHLAARIEELEAENARLACENEELREALAYQIEQRVKAGAEYRARIAELEGRN